MSHRLAGIALAMAALASCDDLLLGDGPRRQAVRDVAHEVILPSLATFADRAATLAARAGELGDAPDAARLAAAQAAWREARAPWMESQAFRIGPVKDLVLDAAIDQSPVEPVRIDAELAGQAPINVPAYGGNMKGFHALEYLLFDPAGGDDAVLAALAGSARRRDLVRALAADLALRATQLEDAWTGGADPYVTRFSDVGAAGATYPTIKMALDGVINETIYLAENMTDTKLGKPLGKNALEPHPELLESPWSDNSLADLESNLRGLDAVWAHGLRALVLARSPAAVARVEGELAAAHAAVAAVPRPLAQNLTTPQASAAWEAVREVRISLKVDVVALLGATLSFNANDGD